MWVEFGIQESKFDFRVDFVISPKGGELVFSGNPFTRA